MFLQHLDAFWFRLGKNLSEQVVSEVTVNLFCVKLDQDLSRTRAESCQKAKRDRRKLITLGKE